ncbi:hypothetical protein [Burkholderia sp. F1]|uniref:hypothetical protein n=1 Tax=Burkholderia sp. F1 TaxID=3366817 RepID=UPI003D73A785
MVDERVVNFRNANSIADAVMHAPIDTGTVTTSGNPHARSGQRQRRQAPSAGST